MNPIDILNPKSVILGESTTDLLSDRGFSPESYGLNLTKSRGMLYFAELPTDIGGATLTGTPIASTYDKNFLGNDAYFLDDGGAFYTLKGSTFTLRQTVTADSFIIGTSDLLQFLGNTYATSATRVIQLTGSDLATVDSGWWTGLTTSYRHPLERVEDTMYIGDVNMIHTWNGTTSTSSAITLPSDVNITSLRKHPDGRNLIAFCGLSANYSHTLGKPGRIYIIDTTLLDWVREIEIEAQVEGSRLVGGTVYVSFGKQIGYFTGDGIKAIRTLTTSGTTYSHCMSNLEDIFVVRDGLNALAYGNLGAGNVWWNMYRNLDNSSSISCLCYKGDNVMLFGYQNSSDGLIKQVDYDNAGLTGFFVSNRILFPKEVMIRKLLFIHDISAAAGTTSFTVNNRDIENTSEQIKIVTYNSQSVSRTPIETALRADFFQITFTQNNDDTGYKLIRGYYETIE